MLPRRGLLVAGIESPALRQVLPACRSRVETFGLAEGADWRAVDLRPTGPATRFRLVQAGRDLGEFELALAGEHNVRNALAALAAAHAVGVEPEVLREPLARFRGVKRRLELRGEAGGVRVYDDFAHHPTAVRETLRAARALLPDGGRLWAIFEPRSYTSRTSVFQDDFGRALALADRVVVAAAHLPGKVPEARRVSEAQLVAAARAAGAEAEFVAAVPEIVAAVAGAARPGDLVLALSNGGFGGIHQRLLEALAGPRAEPATSL